MEFECGKEKKQALKHRFLTGSVYPLGVRGEGLGGPRRTYIKVKYYNINNIYYKLSLDGLRVREPH